MLNNKENTDYSQIKIVREIDGRRIEIPLTNKELYKAFLEQQRLFEEEYVINYLEERLNDKKLRADFKAKYEVDVNVLLKSDELISQIAAGMHRKADKYGMSDEEALREAIKKEAADLV